MLDSNNFTTTSISGIRHQNHKNNNDNKTSCFVLNTIHYKKRRREKNTMTMLQQSNNNSYQLTENIQCLLCRKIIIESNDNFYQHPEPQNINNNNKSLNICTACRSSRNSYDTNTIDTNTNYYFDLCQQPQQQISDHDHTNDRQRENLFKRDCEMKHEEKFIKNRNIYDKSIKKLLSENSCSSSKNCICYKKNDNKKYSEMFNCLIYFLVLLLLNSFFSVVNAQNSSKFNSNVTAEPGGELHISKNFFFVIKEY